MLYFEVVTGEAAGHGSVEPHQEASYGRYQAEPDDEHAADPQDQPLFESGQIGFRRKIAREILDEDVPGRVGERFGLLLGEARGFEPPRGGQTIARHANLPNGTSIALITRGDAECRLVGAAPGTCGGAAARRRSGRPRSACVSVAG